MRRRAEEFRVTPQTAVLRAADPNLLEPVPPVKRKPDHFQNGQQEEQDERNQHRRQPQPGGFGDPAFAVASRVLFRRLASNEAFRGAVGLEGPEDLAVDLRLEEALAPRISWTYLLLAIRSESSPAGSSSSVAPDEALRRATGRIADPLRSGLRDASDPSGAAELRGTVLGLLMEERLLCAVGRDWFTSRNARRILNEAWEAERQETAESVASALDLGTIEPTPILDRCRP